MGDIHSPTPALCIVAAFSRYDEALDWGYATTSAAWGPIALASERFAFTETNYYEPTMGGGIKKCFWAYETLVDPAVIVERKISANAWETDYAALGRHAEERPLNLDPGYITEAKLVLASTKDHAHRIYLHSGIYAEVTLHYRDRRWQAHPWTFPDYRREEYQRFFSECRNYLRGKRSG